MPTMITTKQIEKFIATRPFRQFALKTSDGNHVVVSDPDRIKLPPAGFELVLVYGVDGLVHFLSTTTIIDAAFYGPES
jgi:hypothetical protein